jgi:hypothetical protein
MKALTHWDSAHLSTLRLALALTVSVLIAFIGGWPGAFIMPVLLMVAILLLIGRFIAEVFLPHPVVCLLLIGWLLLAGQYWAIRGGNQLLIVILFIAILILPLVGMESKDLLSAFVGGLLFSIALAVFMCWFAHALIPDPRLVANAKPEQALPSKQETYRQAMIKTLLVLPLLLMFYLLKMTSDLLVLVFVALLIQMPSAEVGIRGSIGTLVANALGGVAAVVCYNLLVLAPSPVAIFTVSLLFGQKIFSGSKTAQLYGTGLNTVVVLLGGATGAFGDGAGTDMYVRLLQIGAACLYIVGALALAEDWLKGDQPAKKVQAAPGYASCARLIVMPVQTGIHLQGNVAVAGKSFGLSCRLLPGIGMDPGSRSG